MKYFFILLLTLSSTLAMAQTADDFLAKMDKLAQKAVGKKAFVESDAKIIKQSVSKTKVLVQSRDKDDPEDWVKSSGNIHWRSLSDFAIRGNKYEDIAEVILVFSEDLDRSYGMLSKTDKPVVPSKFFSFFILKKDFEEMGDLLNQLKDLKDKM